MRYRECVHEIRLLGNYLHVRNEQCAEDIAAWTDFQPVQHRLRVFGCCRTLADISAGVLPSTLRSTVPTENNWLLTHLRCN